MTATAARKLSRIFLFYEISRIFLLCGSFGGLLRANGDGAQFCLHGGWRCPRQRLLDGLRTDGVADGDRAELVGLAPRPEQRCPFLYVDRLVYVTEVYLTGADITIVDATTITTNDRTRITGCFVVKMKVGWSGRGRGAGPPDVLGRCPRPLGLVLGRHARDGGRLRLFEVDEPAHVLLSEHDRGGGAVAVLLAGGRWGRVLICPTVGTAGGALVV